MPLAPSNPADSLSPEARQRAAGVRLLLLDVDGVLTDGSILLDAHGGEIKRFHVRDGSALKLWRSAGHEVGLVSGRASEATTRRAAELGISRVYQKVGDKWPVVERILQDMALPREALAFVGDDLPDLPVVRRAGFGVAVADAVEELRAVADYVTQAPGGRMAVREVVRLLLSAQNRWQDLVAQAGALQSG